MAGRVRSTRKARALGVVVAALALGAAACGGSGGSVSVQEATTTSTTPATLSSSQLQRALLTLSDMPPGWTVDSSPGSSSANASDALCPTGQATIKNETHSEAETSFTQGTTGPFVYQALESAPDASGHMTDFKKAFDSCVGSTWTEDAGGESMTVTLAEVSGAKIGDESASYRLTGQTDVSGVGLTADFVLARNGTVLELYGGMSVTVPGQTTTQLDPQQFASIVTTGNTKVSTALSGG